MPPPRFRPPPPQSPPNKMKSPTKVCHGEMPRREWPRIRKMAGAIFFSLGLPQVPVDTEKRRARRRAHYARNKEKFCAEGLKYREANRDELREGAIEYRKKNSGKIKIAARRNRKSKQARLNQRRRVDPNFRMSQNLRARVYEAIVCEGGGTKSASTRELVGCTIPELRARLESKFRPGMTWENYGPVWHIDHIKPCAKFDLLDPAQQRLCFNYRNLQPLFAEENLRKGDKYANPHEN